MSDPRHSAIGYHFGIKLSAVPHQFADIAADSLKELLDLVTLSVLLGEPLLHQCCEVICDGGNLEHFFEKHLNDICRITSLFILIAEGEEVIQGLIILAEVRNHAKGRPDT